LVLPLPASRDQSPRTSDKNSAEGIDVMTLRTLADDLRRLISETLVGWAMAVAPMTTPADYAYGRRLDAALAGAVEALKRRSARR
jgi:hypothetical protein